MNRRLLALALLLPGAALADRCEFSAPRSLDLDLDGIREVRVEVNSHDLELRADDGPARFAGTACASDQASLDRLMLTGERSGEVLHVRLYAETSSGFSFGSRYTNLKVHGSLPAGLPLHIEVNSGDAVVQGIDAVSADLGSGDLEIRDAQRLTAEVGSGDLEARNVRGPVRVELGSGDIDLEDIGALQIARVGSGDLKAQRIDGDVRVDDLGSGEIELRGVRGSVQVDSVASGDLVVRDVSGDLTVGYLGSGDVEHSGVAGSVRLPAD